MRRHRSVALIAILTIVVLGTTACAGSSGAPGTVIETETLPANIDVSSLESAVDDAIVRVVTAQGQATTPDEKAQLAIDKGLLDYLKDVVLEALKTTFAGRLHWVGHSRIKYWSTDASGKAVRLSGMMFVPYIVKWDPHAFPLLSLQHGTQIYRPYAPSLFTYDMKNLFKDGRVLAQIEVVLGIFMAVPGYVVVMPDYPSLGVSTDPHPYTHLSIANSVEDMLKAARAVLADEWRDYATWDGRVFMSGYSEGGYATLVTASQLQAKGSDLTPAAVAPLDGPHDLSTTMRTLMVADRQHPSAYFLPYMLYGEKFIYGDAVYGFSKTMRSPYDATLPPFLDGTAKGEQVVAAMAFRPGATYPVPADILTADFLALVQRSDTGDPAAAGPVVTMLAANDAYRGWTPSMALKLFHCATDDLVPRGNSDKAYAEFKGRNAPRLEPIGDVEPLPIPDATVHVQAALPAYMNGYMWIDTHYKK